MKFVYVRWRRNVVTLHSLVLFFLWNEIDSKMPMNLTVTVPVPSLAPLHIHDVHEHSSRFRLRFSIRNMTCDFFKQPLNHFAIPKDSSLFWNQRFCVYNDFAFVDTASDDNPKTAPIFLYTGNESPLEQYINNTGFMWELAAKFRAQIVFIEHRYEGKSLPPPNITNCMAYSSSVQALADYANFIQQNVFQADNRSSGALQKRPVISFGGSYGGMLSAWMRMKYPHVIAGAIAASAPIWGFPRNFPDKIDTASQIITRAMDHSHPPTKPKRHDNYCASNFVAAQPLIQTLGETLEGRELLTRVFLLCDPLQHAEALMEWIRAPWFDLAEGSFPYPSSYITFALLHREVKLPAWPLQAACWSVSSLYQNCGVQFEGNLTNVLYNVTYGDSGLKLGVNWDELTVLGSGTVPYSSSSTIMSLLENVRRAVSIWYNVTKDVQCYNLTAAPNLEESAPRHIRFGRQSTTKTVRRILSTSNDPVSQCRDEMQTSGSWPALCCNEEMNLILVEARGLGHDAVWPPSHPRGTRNHADVIATTTTPTVDASCNDPDGIFGFSQQAPDPWATWMDTYYGGTRIESHSNIVFSNGLLDPWSGAGVYAKGLDPTRPDFDWQSSSSLAKSGTPGLYVQNITDNGSMIALIMEYGGHHTDLMYSDEADPPCITQARRIEAAYIARWIREWNSNDASKQ